MNRQREETRSKQNDDEREALLIKKVQRADGTEAEVIIGQSTLPQTIFNASNGAFTEDFSVSIIKLISFSPDWSWNAESPTWNTVCRLGVWYVEFLFYLIVLVSCTR